ncbi:unnamed protein product [Allacma fusca]|uniref:Uncharacterized protein n=1 Tax=Allacma fusca TaxID=39272 RepID=A0A8J2JP69_9HEXA|nr:unnamed protein product [Allacma fusca]
MVVAMLKLVNEAPKASCVECKGLITSSGSNSPTSDTEFNNNISLSSLILSNGSSSGCTKASSTLNGTSTTSTSTIATTTTNNCWDQLDVSNPFGKAFHGYLLHSQTLELLTKDGQFLVRKQDNDDDFILSLRFNGLVKHFIISCDDSTGFLYVGERDKPYHSLQELVQEGLTTMYLDLKAGCYIDLMCDLTHFHNGTNGHQKFNHSRKNSSSPSPSASTASRSSIERQRNPDLKTHSFSIHTFEGLSRCQICQNFMWGLSSQGLQCKDCGFSIHESCAEKTFNECEPRVEFLKEIFGTDLTTLVKAAGGGKPPFVLEKCIVEIEKRGLHTEGIYRVSGSRELIERLKSFLEQDRESADLSQYVDIHSMCGLVKLYLRLLPQPLITTDVFQKFLTASGPLTLDMIKRNLRKLPLAHQITLKYLLQHLYRVAGKCDKNKMTSFNLSSVFAPSVLCPTLISLNTLKIGTNILETMIAHYPQLFPQ